MGWFTTFIYFPAMTSVLAWVSARYLGVLCGFDITGGPVMVIACLFLVGSYAVNALSPILAGKFQVATTVIKLIPLLLHGHRRHNRRPCQRHNDRKLHHRRHNRRGRQRPRAVHRRGGNGLCIRGLDHRHEHQRRAQECPAQPADRACHRHAHRRTDVYPLLHWPVRQRLECGDHGRRRGRRQARLREDLRPGRRRGSVRAGRGVVPRHAQRAHASRDAQPLLRCRARQRPEAGGVPRHRPIHEHAGKLRHRGQCSCAPSG